MSDDIVSELDSFNFEWKPQASYSKPKQYPNTLQGRIQELKDCHEKHGPSLNGMKKKGKSNLLRFCRDLRQSRENPGNPKYQLSERDIAELNSIGFEWDKAPQKQKRKKAKVKINSKTLEKIASPPANGEKYTQMEVIELSLIHGKTLIIDAIVKSKISQPSRQLYQCFPRPNQLFTDDIVRELLCKHVV